MLFDLVKKCIEQYVILWVHAKVKHIENREKIYLMFLLRNI